MAPTSQQQREFHLVLLGATGFTGKLVARYLSSHPTSPRWAIAGRNPSRLSSLRASLKLPASVGTVHADLTDEASLREMCRRAACIVSTAGPFRKLGAERVVRICAEEGTAWTDLSGETAFNESVQKCVVVPLSPPPPLLSSSTAWLTSISRYSAQVRRPGASNRRHPRAFDGLRLSAL
jgi:hypothetical protein